MSLLDWKKFAMQVRTYHTAWIVILLSAFLCGFTSHPIDSVGADIVLTAASSYDALAALHGGERFQNGAHLRVLHHGLLQDLVPQFADSSDAQVSFDGQRILFAGKPHVGDPWQIWELQLSDHALRRLIAGEQDAILPFYLPYGSFVYAQHTAHGFQLEVAGKRSTGALDPIVADPQSSAHLITHLSGSALPQAVLHDGRILFASSYPLGSGSKPELYLTYSDGSGVESYRCDHQQAEDYGRWGGHQLASGDLLFTHGRSLALFTPSSADEVAIHAPQAEYDGGIAETHTGDLIVSARNSSHSSYALKLLTLGTEKLRTIVNAREQNLVEPVLLAPSMRPKRHPSALHNWSYANLLALDARLERDGSIAQNPVQVQLETQDKKGNAVVVGHAQVEPDGSFFVKVPANRPIRFALLDQNGRMIRQQQGWFWSAAGEQRICVGCHTGPERAATNHVPQVMLRSTTPRDLTQMPDL